MKDYTHYKFLLKYKQGVFPAPTVLALAFIQSNEICIFLLYNYINVLKLSQYIDNP